MVDLPTQIPSSDQLIVYADTASALVSQYVVAPIAQLGIAGFNLSIVKIYKSELKSDVTDHFVEKNVAYQDQIALKSEIFTITGVVGELVYQNTKGQSTIQKLATKLTTISGFLPVLTDAGKQLQSSVVGAQTAGGTSAYLNAALGSGIDLYQTFKKLNPPKTKQAAAYNYFAALRNGRQLISFDTPYGFKSSFVIWEFSFMQPEKTDGYSEVELVLKQIQVATTKTVPFDSTMYSGRTAAQLSSPVGQTNLQGLPVSFDTTLTNNLQNLPSLK